MLRIKSYYMALNAFSPEVTMGGLSWRVRDVALEIVLSDRSRIPSALWPATKTKIPLHLHQVCFQIYGFYDETIEVISLNGQEEPIHGGLCSTLYGRHLTRSRKCLFTPVLWPDHL